TDAFAAPIGLVGRGDAKTGGKNIDGYGELEFFRSGFREAGGRSEHHEPVGRGGLPVPYGRPSGAGQITMADRMRRNIFAGSDRTLFVCRNFAYDLQDRAAVSAGNDGLPGKTSGGLSYQIR